MIQDNEELRASLKEAQIEAIYVGDEAFNKAKVQALVLQPDLNIDEMDFFKVIREGQLMYLESNTYKTGGVPEKESLVGHIKNNPTDNLVQ